MGTILIAGALAVCGGTAAIGQDMTSEHLAALDTGGDGMVDAGELSAVIGKAFTGLDTNGDGCVTLAESSGS